MTKLLINLNDLLRKRTVEGECIEYKIGWNPEAIFHNHDSSKPKRLDSIVKNGVGL